jgi:hypothetical protein
MRKQLKEPNPKNVFENRSMPVPPPHFEYTEMEFRYNMENVVHDWIYDNLKGRFYVGKSTDQTLNTMLKIGFEEGKELSYFSLACPHLKYK